MVEFDQKCQNQSNFQLFSTIFDIFLIKIDQFGTFGSFFSFWNRFHRHDLDFNNDFGSKILIKWRFKSNFKQNLAQGRSNCISLKHWRYVSIWMMHQWKSYHNWLLLNFYGAINNHRRKVHDRWLWFLRPYSHRLKSGPKKLLAGPFNEKYIQFLSYKMVPCVCKQYGKYLEKHFLNYWD